jgi:hypothetical protein
MKTTITGFNAGTTTRLGLGAMGNSSEEMIMNNGGINKQVDVWIEEEDRDGRDVETGDGQRVRQNREADATSSKSGNGVGKRVEIEV